MQAHAPLPSRSKRIRAPQSGQVVASAVHGEPAATHTARAGAAAQATSGSSALATTVVSGWRVHSSRHDAAMVRTSPMRSSWSRERFMSRTTSGLVASTARGRYRSSHSRTAGVPAGAVASAATSPGTMLAPVSLVATAPSVPTAAASSRVVVVLPFVPLTKATRWPTASWARAVGSAVSRTRPRRTVPVPTRARREASATTRLTGRAVRSRHDTAVGATARR